MGFSAIYLDHHYVIDVILGTFYCLAASTLVRFVESRFTSPPAPEPVLETSAGV